MASIAVGRPLGPFFSYAFIYKFALSHTSIIFIVEHQKIEAVARAVAAATITLLLWLLFLLALCYGPASPDLYAVFAPIWISLRRGCASGVRISMTIWRSSSAFYYSFWVLLHWTEASWSLYPSQRSIACVICRSSLGAQRYRERLYGMKRQMRPSLHMNYGSIPSTTATVNDKFYATVDRGLK